MKTTVRSGAIRRHTSRAQPSQRWVFGLSELGRVERVAPSPDDVLSLLGGKGAHLAEMTRLGLPVPPGFIVTTEACRAASSTPDALPEPMWNAILDALERLEEESGKRFGDPSRPLLVSCRSGAKFSMPGMMDTVLNLGLNDEIAAALATQTGDARFAFDAYRRLIQMFGTVVLNAGDEPFELLLEERRKRAKVSNDADLSEQDLREVTQAFKRLVLSETGRAFPENPREQLALAIGAVFRSWNSRRAIDYRRATGIPNDLGTAVNVMAMVFGNLGSDSGTGVATTRNVTTGEDVLEGDFLINAQGEDVVAGTRATLPITRMAETFPEPWNELQRIAQTLERHYRDVQDIEFTIERGKLWMLQTRTAKRTALAAVRIAVELCEEKLITREEAVARITPEQVDDFLHPQFQIAARRKAREHGALLATGLNVSPGAAVGQLAFDADTAERWARQEKKAVVMVRSETRPDDVHGLLAARGVLTSHGGRTSHAALVARQFGKPAVVGASSLEINAEERTLKTARGVVLREGDWVSLDGTTGEVFSGQLPTVLPDLTDAHLVKLLSWADGIRTLGVLTNADSPEDASRARLLGAEGIGLCRTEHMFFEPDRLPHVQRMIVARTDEERAEALAALLPSQRADFDGLFRAMNGLPVTIRLLDPPLHEFLPDRDQLKSELAELEARLTARRGVDPVTQAELARKRKLLEAVDLLHEHNPMLGLRGVRLAIQRPEIVRMQVRAIFEAACHCLREGVRVRPRLMIPLTATDAELREERRLIAEEVAKVTAEHDCAVPYEFGTMIEVPRAALVAGDLAEHASFFSFGTNDLTQTTFGMSRDDAETSFLQQYLERGLLRDDPFATIDRAGVGALMKLAVEQGRARRPDLDFGICGEHGGDPRSIEFCHELGLHYVSCSPLRVPIARLAAAHAALKLPKSAAPRGTERRKPPRAAAKPAPRSRPQLH